MDLKLPELIISIIVSSYSIGIGIFALLQINRINEKSECLVFFLLSLLIAAWALSSFINPFYRAYGFITGIILTNVAVIYALKITNFKLIKIFLPFLLIVTSIVFFLIFKGEAGSSNFSIEYGLLVYPLLFFMNYVIYYYFYKLRTKFHLSLGVMTSIMIFGGFYETFKKIYHWPSIPTTMIGCLGFVLIAGYNLLDRGYLHQKIWKDYALELEEKKKLLNGNNTNLYKINFDTVIILSQTIEAKDPYTRGHCLRVMNFSKAIGKILKFDKERLKFLKLGAVLHDIGKIGIAGAILNKHSNLTIKEFTEIKKHPEIGANILKTVDFFNPIIPIIRHHHEFFNGKGYPDGLKGEGIPLEARILGVVDAYDAMTSDRPYRKAFNTDKALRILKKISGTQLDPKIVDIFIENKIYQKKINLTDKLNLGF